jgi:asparagine synthase (glutamine-hydrolysing)
MSGLCGIVCLDGRSAEQPSLAAMTRVLEPRGPDAIRHWLKGPVGFGHTLLATTPEALVERLPLTHASTGCTISADVRLDNREELIAALGLPQAGRVIGDGELILHAYLKWGDQCPTRLLGDFAFAIWDPRHRRLFAARDHMGMRSLVFAHVPGVSFAFATEPDAVLAFSGRSRDINHGRVGDFVLGREWLDYSSTFFCGVERLPPAHSLTLENGGVRQARYWRLEPEPDATLRGEADYIAAFRAVFEQAVACRLRSNGEVGAMLSGGLDSGTVAATAAQILSKQGAGPLVTISAIDPLAPNCRESALARLSASMGGVAPRFVNQVDPQYFNPSLLAQVRASKEPFDAPMVLLRAIYNEARSRGLRVVLDGAASDQVFAYGSYVRWLIRHGRWRRALGEIRGTRAFWQNAFPLSTLVAREVRGAILPNWLRRIRPRSLASAHSADRFRQIIRPDYLAAHDLDGRMARHAAFLVGAGIPFEQELSRSIARPHLTRGRERYERIAMGAGVEPRDPFMDVRVIRFCAALPGDLRLKGGWPKYLLRQAAPAALPDPVKWRRGREHVGWAYWERLLTQYHEAWSGEIDEARGALGEIITPGAIDEAQGNLARQQADGTTPLVAVLAAWINHTQIALDQL